MQALNPATELPLKEYANHSEETVNLIISEMQAAFVEWKKTAIPRKKQLLEALANVLEEHTSEFARLMAEEMGKPISEGKAEIEKCAWVCRYYAEHGASFLQDELINSDAKKSYVSYQPLGIVFAIMPWNFPFWQVFRCAVPSMLAGNVVLLKHAPNVPGCAQAIEVSFQEAGFPPHVFRNVFIDTEQAANIIARPLVRAVTLTGSTRAGKAVAAQAGAFLKKSVLELGGSDPYIVLEDADINLAIETCAASRLINNGQSCIAAKRFIVHQSIAQQFEDGLVAQMRAKKMGNPLEKGVELGPMARKDLREELHRQVTESVAKGATCILGGTIPEGKGFFYPPTVLTQVQKGMPAYHEELFGPVASIIVVNSEEEAIHIANDTTYGLGAAIFSKDEARAEKIARSQLHAGCCFVNAFVKSDPRLPFGGIKDSGYGRELSLHGIREFVNAKTVYLA